MTRLPTDDRRYHGRRIDGSRWDRFDFRPGDVIVATPSKCGTTWVQNIVVRLLRGPEGLERPISLAAPWIDMTFDDEVDLFGLLAAEPGRRVLKTHAPLDGIPTIDGVTLLTVARHPLDAALSDADHAANTDEAAAATAFGIEVPANHRFPDPPTPAERLRTYLAAETHADGTGPHSLVEYAHYVRQMWIRRHRPDVHLLHYQDLWDDLPGQVVRIADLLGLDAGQVRCEAPWHALTLGAMRARSGHAAPEAHRAIWRSSADFFRQGGRRDWASLLSTDEVDEAWSRMQARLDDLPLDVDGRSAADWAWHGGPLADPVAS